MERLCRLCRTTDPTHFYETQTSRLCKACWKATYTHAGRDRLIQSKLDRSQCLDCGLAVTLHNASVFDYDHRDPTQKFKNVSRLRYAPLEVFLAELSKCDLVCANCHRLRTQARGYTMSGGRPRLTPHETQPTPAWSET